MQVYRLTSLDELAPYREDWQRLAAEVPFRSWSWLSAWWRHYGLEKTKEGRYQLSVFCVFDGSERLVGLAPWYLDRATRTLRLLGSGEVCSDYLTVLSQPELVDAVTEAVAEHLVRDSRGRGQPPLAWDLLHLEGVDGEDRAIGQLVRQLAQQGCTPHYREGLHCWRLPLPGSWAQYVAGLSKNHRKQVRRLQRNVLDSGRVLLRPVQNLQQLPETIELLIELHQRRRRALGQRGCFLSERFTAFHREVMPVMLQAGQLQLHLLELDGRPAAVEYGLSGGGVIYAYQSGFDPALLSAQPGRLAILAVLRWAIEQGYRAYDFLRGDEAYKGRFGAIPRPSPVIRVVPDRIGPRLRHRLWLAGSRVKRWLRGGSPPAARSPLREPVNSIPG